MRLDLTSYESAIDRLTEGLARYQQDPSDSQIRDGLIQRFEFTYEIAHKTLRRYLEQSAANPAEFDQATFQDLIRTANEQGLIRGDWTHWKRYRELRRLAAHACDEYTALEVVNGIPPFLAEVTILRDVLRSRLTHD